MKETSKILIGGAALNHYGSARFTSDTDYLVHDATRPMFFRDAAANVDFCNAAANEFFAEVMKSEGAVEICSPQGLLELKAYALVQHCQNGYWKKADDCEFDIAFLVRTFGLTSCPIAAKYVSGGELSEITKIIRSVK